MSYNSTVLKSETVALLAEGVDRNFAHGMNHSFRENVALLAEGVDRNHCRPFASPRRIRRPPRGGRG